jgi:hypothetical protein
MVLCDENKGTNARIVDMFFKTKLVPMRKRFSYKIKASGKIILFTNKPIKN